ncbi:hypothetical protein [Kitasatospora cheerisanensis]|uniref:Uncharacterized protein n=1 Tax=Kitasatospora cheerisanensis KCTC 2395 TaxID=1348663 RepID=A0A066Z878_9ACTN|nr:hypothetical protein [Kitasatospora cheerisanensis]KDN86375.1 hypothetical protein KCH_21920 [Kitasatospora cheerisanensis KCTC 2395]
MDRCTTETRNLLQRILSGWHELAPLLSHLEQHLAENTGYVVQVQPANLSLSADRIAKYLAEDHPQPGAAISHLHDWLTHVMGPQQRGDWVGFLARVQGGRGLTMHQRADFVVIADILCFPPVPPTRASAKHLRDLASSALTSGSIDRLTEELSLLEPQLAQQARKAMERSRTRVAYRISTRHRTALAVGATLLATAGVVTAVALPHGPPPLPDQAVKWSPADVQPGDGSSAEVNVPAEANRLVAHIQLTDKDPDLGSCPGMKIALSAEPGGSTGWQAPDKPLSVTVPPGHSGLRITLRLQAPTGCEQHIDTQRVEFER